MPYIGFNPTNAGSFIELDDIASTFNGSGDVGTDVVAFTLQVGSVSITPNIQNLLIMLDGVVQQPTSAFNVSGSTITFTEAPQSGADFYGVLMGQSASVGGGTIGADELKVSGDGSNGQVLTSDGDGTFSWATDAEDYLPLGGGQMSGAIDLNSQNVTNGGTITGTFVGNVTGNASGTALTVTQEAQTAITSVGTLTSLTVDDITINGSTISDAGDFTLDVGGTIILDGDTAGDNIHLKDGGTHYGSIVRNNSDLEIRVVPQDEDIVFRGNDGGSQIDALKLDMSAGGAAFFNGDISTGATGDLNSRQGFFSGKIVSTSASALSLGTSASTGGGSPNFSMTGTNPYINLTESDTSAQFHWDLAGSNINHVLENDAEQRFYVNNALQLTLTSSTATFAGDVTLGGDTQLETAYTNLQLYMPDNATGLVLANGSSTADARNWGIYTNYSHWGALDFRVSSARDAVAHTTEVLSLKKDGSATFAGRVTFPDGSAWTNGGRLSLNSNRINCGYAYNEEDHDMWINYEGYNDGATKYRDFRVGNGKEGQICFFDGSDGVIDGDFNDTSDIAMKKEISEISSTLDKVELLKPSNFKWKASLNRHDRNNIGFIAQEVEEQFPNLVHGEEDRMAINTLGVVAILTKAVQELSAKVTALENA